MKPMAMVVDSALNLQSSYPCTDGMLITDCFYEQQPKAVRSIHFLLDAP
jgi:hypothetical protein